MFFMAVLVMGAASLFGLAADEIKPEEKQIVQEIKFTPVHCFNTPTQKLVIRPDFVGCVIGEDQPLGETEIVEGTDRPEEINPLVLARFLSAQAAAKELGIELSIDSGYRSPEKQNYLYQRAIKTYKSAEEAMKWVLPSDLSRHPWGLALDVNLNHDKSGATWLEANGAAFGLCRVYVNEWWHFEPLTAPGGICPPLLPDASQVK
ncbi:D-alanyl-D-alanine carboxypeptidase [Candidatus Planktophila limnetica]|uniref:D-alanyl-D-alanine carboxypeptidase n=1 Tax=Candidatus Planktophila limnetica TaxID=573600 RepID=A0A249LE24_9ACTN|nr:D-alanyl-D-alanine carboxypeptidase family protein [Candidatus Planktophila limnetica]ASY27135.1 D-alanyl-D-alanine carboxypeptidase [Candidatus Planktophila limnetica]